MNHYDGSHVIAAMPVPPRKKKFIQAEEEKLEEAQLPTEVERPSAFTESFNQDKLWFCLTDPITKNIIFKDDKKNKWKSASQYLATSQDGVIDVSYFQKPNADRRYAVNSLSMQSMPRKLRHTICEGKWFDIDISNCGPVILQSLCEQLNAKLHYQDRLRIDCLQDLNENREERLLSLHRHKKIAKKIVVAVINGGVSWEELNDRPEWIKKFKKEMEQIRSAIRKHNLGAFYRFQASSEDKNDEDQLEKSFVSHLIRKQEDRIMMTALEFCGFPKMCVLVYDGFQLQYLPDLEKLNAYVQNKFPEVKNLHFVNKPMDEGLVLPEIIPRYRPPPLCPTFDFKDPYTFSDFQQQFGSKVWNSQKELWDALDVTVPRVMGKCLKGEGFYFKKLTSGLDRFKTLKECDFYMTYKTEEKKEQKKDSTKQKSKKQKKNSKKEGFMTETLFDYWLRKRPCEEFECIMNPLKTNPKNYNLWAGFQAKRTTVRPHGLTILLQFIKDIFCSPKGEGSYDVKIYNYLMSWFRGTVHNLDDINKVALIFQGLQGCGKNTLVPDFLKWVYGEDNMWSNASGVSFVLNNLVGIENKRIVVVNECASTWEELRPNFDKFKTLITDNTQFIRRLYFDQYRIQSISNFILITNHKDSIVIEQGDRHYMAVAVSEIHRDDWNYFAMIRRECFNQEVADAFYTMLLDATDFEIVPLNKFPHTELRAEFQQASQSSTYRFITQRVQRRPQFFIQQTALFEEFNRWRVKQGEKNIISQTTFGLKLCNVRGPDMKPLVEKAGPQKRHYQTVGYIKPPKGTPLVSDYVDWWDEDDEEDDAEQKTQ